MPGKLENRVVAFETSFVVTGEAAVGELGAQIARGLRCGDLVALSGELGAGKTTLARAVLRALGVAEDAPSPTFTLVQSYLTKDLTVRHYDLYRLNSASEVFELGLEDALDEGAALVEWPENGLPEYLKDDALRVSISVTGLTTRDIHLSGPQRWRAIFAGTRQ